MRAKKSSAATAVVWRALVLGGLLGYILAVVLGGDDGSSAAGGPINRWHRLLKNHAEATSEEQGEVASSSEHEEGGADAVVTMDTTVAAIVVFLICLTILFEYVKEAIEEAADRTMKPVIQGLFGELTVLGFLSIVTFLVTKMGWFTRLSEHLFGEEDEEELLETFEFVHYMLFFIMVFFVINVLVLVHGGQAMEKTWWTYNMACLDPEFMAMLDALSSPGIRQTTYLQYLCQTLFPCRSATQRLRSELQMVRDLRQEFILERSVKPPFAPHATNHVEDDFNFGRYLSICLGHELGHMVHLNNYTWIFLGVLTLIFYGIALGLDNSLEDFAWAWAGTGWFFFLVGNYFDYHMVYLLENMAGDHSTAANGQDGGETGSLLASTLPAWTRIDLEYHLVKGRSVLSQCCLSSKVTITRQDALYWLERKGPKYYLILFQIQMVFTAAYVSLLILLFFPFLFAGSVQSSLERWGYVVISLLPVYLLLSKYQTAAANLTMACSIGVHRRPQAVSQVIREGKTDRIIRAMITMQKLQRAAACDFTATQHHSEVSTTTTTTTTTTTSLQSSSRELVEVAKTFDALDHSGDGKIDTSELSQVLKSLGATATEESLAAMIVLLDKNKDGNISRDEFLEFYKDHMSFDLDHHGLHQLANDMFEQIDSDGSGEITLSEFKEVLEAFNVGFSVDEIGDLVNELDEQDNGTIGVHEFVELLEKHAHLFEKIQLPKLE